MLSEAAKLHLQVCCCSPAAKGEPQIGKEELVCGAVTGEEFAPLSGKNYREKKPANYRAATAAAAAAAAAAFGCTSFRLPNPRPRPK